MKSRVRTWLLSLAISGGVLTHPSGAQSLSEAIATDILRSVAALTRYVSSVVQAAETVDVSQIKPADRAAALGQLKTLTASLDDLIEARGFVVNDIDAYIQAFRRGERPTAREWNKVLDSVDGALDHVRQVRQLESDSDWMSVAVQPNDRQALSDILDQKVGISRRLAELNRPDTEPEISQLASIAASYERLRAELRALRETFGRTQSRLESLT